ncbi:MAG: hypothetical protein RBU21_17110 [FCB group bacterium]|nr:hypothetical protein [FCB group bacterium]
MKKLTLRQRLILVLMVVWALAGVTGAYLPAAEGASSVLQSLIGSTKPPNPWSIRHDIGRGVAGGICLVLALATMTAGCCAVIPLKTTRRLAKYLYLALMASTVIISLGEPHLRRWAGTSTLVNPDLALIPAAVGIVGLTLLGISHWLCPSLYGMHSEQTDEPLIQGQTTK